MTSTRFTVATHALVALAANSGGPVRSEQIAASANTNPAVIRRLFSMLAKAGITHAQLGAGGGATLARDPSDIRLLDVYRAVEDSQLFAMHRGAPDKNCFVGKRIQGVLQPHFARAQTALEQELARVTLADITQEVLQRNQA